MNTTPIDDDSGSVENPLFRCLESERRRAILRELLGGAPLTVRDLAASVSAAAGDRTASASPSPSPGPSRSSSPDAMTDARVEIEHVHLPLLESAGLVSRDGRSGAVDRTDHPALGDPRFERLLGIDAAGVDEVFSALAHEYRRVALSLLADGHASLPRDELAREICRPARRPAGADGPPADDVAVSLHHVHLPKLDGAGLVEYDAETGRVTYSGHAVLEEVLGTVYGRPTPAADRLDGVFERLHDTYREVSERAHGRSDPAPFWTDPYDG